MSAEQSQSELSPVMQMELALSGIKAIADILLIFGRGGHEGHRAFNYLGRRLDEHYKQAWDAFCQLTAPASPPGKEQD